MRLPAASGGEKGYLFVESQRITAGENRYLMPRCDHCGSHVSDRFARVFADENGDLNACPECSANAGIAEVARERARTGD